MAKKTSRVPDVVKNIPIVGDIATRGDQQAQWVQMLLEEQARLIVGLPDTLKTLNDSIETFQATVQTLDKVVTRVDHITEPLLTPLEELGPRIEKLTNVLDRASLGQIPDLIDTVRTQALPALASATNAQKQVETVAASVEKLIGVLGEVLNSIPGAALVTRVAGGGRKAAPVKEAPSVAPAPAPVKAAKATPTKSPTSA